MYYIPLHIFKNIFKLLLSFIFLLVIKEICEKPEHQKYTEKEHQGGNLKDLNSTLTGACWLSTRNCKTAISCMSRSSSLLAVSF